MNTHKRAGFTLLEVLVVFAIIAILAGLLFVVISSVIHTGEAAQTRIEIAQLSAALDKFYGDFGFYPPSRLKLCSDSSGYGNTKLDADSQAALRKRWGMGAFTAINWGNRTPAPTPGNLVIDVLEGDQVLVFLLGGIPNGINAPPIGFSIDRSNPAALGGKREFGFVFAGSRMVTRPGSVFPSFLDPYRKQPYLYFGSFVSPNGYDATPHTLGVSPYASQLAPFVTYHRPETFQIISAGQDGQFGPGGLWNPATASALPQAGRDDVTNIHDKVMGIP